MAKRILFIGESWFTYSVHQKGFDVFHTSEYVEGGSDFIKKIKESDFDVTYVPAHKIEEDVPNSVSKLKQYDIIIISDVGANSFLLGRETFNQSKVVPNKLQAISDYVKTGGSLLMVGGYMTFTGIDAKARFGSSPLRDCLPINMLDVDDRVERPEGVVPRVCDGTHEIMNGLPHEWPVLLGYNKFTAKEDSQTLALVGDDPLIVIGEFGNGKSGAFASDLAPHWAPPEFVSWENYTKLWVQLINWLTK